MNWKKWIINYAKKTPYCHIGSYMERNWILPYRHMIQLKWYKNPIGWLLQQFDVAIRVHHILKSDDSRSFHDHPWNYLSVILDGGYYEVTPSYDSSDLYLGEKHAWYGAGSVLFRRAKSQHKLELKHIEIPCKAGGNDRVILTATTLFITFKKTQAWGFFENPASKIYYKDYFNKYGENQ